MQLNYVLSIINRADEHKMTSICMDLELPIALTLLGRGTATKRIFDLYGLEETEKAIILTVADEERTSELILQVRKKLYIDIPGNGIVLSVPIKSVGGGKTLAFLSDNKSPDKSIPNMNFEYELIVVVANEGHTEQVMDSARLAGAMGGTVLHAKGTGAQKAKKFYGVSIIDEKEVILIVAKSSEKAVIMHNIIKDSDIDNSSAAIAFSLPVSDVAGINLLNNK